MKDPTNTVFSLAFDFINYTSRSVFLTGKAGTGKTTFLKYVRENSNKSLAVVAPTGVAAINAGGMTMHSFFQLPLGIFLPGYKTYEGSVQISNRNTLFKNLRLTKDKRTVLQELELLIIDEVSMVRADMLDATDAILRFVRRSTLPFGGVQVLFIGDLYQLSPVAKQEEWNLLSDHYESPFFFHAKVIQQAPPLCLELNKIYRQNEQQFIDLLNNIRNNAVTDDDLEKLRGRYQADVSTTKGYVTLTTHNAKADAINQKELEKLPGKLHKFEAVINGDFFENNFPTDKTLFLKEGASVMFIRNDVSEERKYFNGKLATVKQITDDDIIVQFEDGTEHLLERVTWQNIRYSYNQQNDEIEEEELGSFMQYPVRLAWAITIHKSQGLTFQKAIVDAGSSFAAGQVYVALSRCTSLEGLILKSPISRHQIKTDQKVVDYSNQLQNVLMLQDLLKQEKELYEQNRLIGLFDFSKIHKDILDWAATIGEKKIPGEVNAVTLTNELKAKAEELKTVSEKTRQHMHLWFEQARNTNSFDYVLQRSKDAVLYFNTFLHDNFFTKLQKHVESLKAKRAAKKYRKEVTELAMAIANHAKRLRSSQLLGQPLYLKGDITFPELSTIVVKSKPAKGESALESLMLFNRGYDVQKIAATRNLSASTIEEHLAQCVKNKKLDIEKLVDSHRVETIIQAITELNTRALSPIREKLGEGYSFGEIRAVMYHWQNLNPDAFTAISNVEANMQK